LKLPVNKTKIICTIGPASASQEIIEQMIRAGMNVARLNFSHGDFASHAKIIENVRSASRATGQRVAIMGDLPGPKIRIGILAQENIKLTPGDSLTLTTEQIVGDSKRVSINFDCLPQVVKTGNTLFLNDGLIQLQVVAVEGNDVRCRVLVGGELSSHKGLNLPDIALGISAFTKHDHEYLKFALDQNVDAICQSFVDSAADISTIRDAARALGYNPFIIAKIERSRSLTNLDEILLSTDGIMVARGDLGVEIPIERIAIVQKEVIHKANLIGKPVITATQMLASMTRNPRPTRAESTDVANAILDGTDCIMLSEESAMGVYPVQAVAMLTRISMATESLRPSVHVRQELKKYGGDYNVSLKDLITLSVESAVENTLPAAVMVPSRSGASARSIARLRLPVWIAAVSSKVATCQQLQFSYGVYPVHIRELPEDWNKFTRDWVRSYGLEGNIVILSAGPSEKHPEANNRMEIIDLSRT
jgi:pyruvate kinase